MNTKTKLRLFIYTSIAIIFTFSVIHHRNKIIKSNQRKAVTIYSLQKEKGKPVKVTRLTKQNVIVDEKITLTPLSENILVGYVPKIIKQSLSIGENIIIDDGTQDITGNVTIIGETLNIDKGLYPITITASNVKMDLHYIASIPIETLQNVLVVPSEILQESEIWITSNTIAKKQSVKIIQRGNYGTIIEGLEEGQMVITEGYTKLFNGDKIAIISSEE